MYATSAVEVFDQRTSIDPRSSTRSVQSDRPPLYPVKSSNTSTGHRVSLYATTAPVSTPIIIAIRTGRPTPPIQRVKSSNAGLSHRAGMYACIDPILIAIDTEGPTPLSRRKSSR